jgi:flagellar biosynthesis protein
MNNNRKSSDQKTVIALNYDGTNAPRVSAKGTGLTGENILKVAHEHGIPLHQNSSLAKALACIPLGEEIPQELYLVVAEVLAFVYSLDELHTNKKGV